MDEELREYNFLLRSNNQCNEGLFAVVDIALLQAWRSCNFLITPNASAWDSLQNFGQQNSFNTLMYLSLNNCSKCSHIGDKLKEGKDQGVFKNQNI